MGIKEDYFYGYEMGRIEGYDIGSADGYHAGYSDGYADGKRFREQLEEYHGKAKSE